MKLQETREAFNIEGPSSTFCFFFLGSAAAAEIVTGLCLIVIATGFAAKFFLLIVYLIQVKICLELEAFSPALEPALTWHLVNPVCSNRIILLMSGPPEHVNSKS